MTTMYDIPPFTDPGVLVAALPALFGFVPRRSLVVLVIEGGSRQWVGQLLRANLDQLDHHALAQLRQLLEARDPAASRSGLYLVILDDSCAERSPEHMALCTRFVGLALPRGQRLVGAIWAAGTAVGSPWQALVGPHARGETSDPRSSVAWAARVFDGEVVCESRDGLRERLMPVEAAQTRVRRALGRLAKPQSGRTRLAAQQEMLKLLRGRDSVVTCAQAARFALALRSREVRDRFVAVTVEAAQSDGLCGASVAGGLGAESLWAQLTRMLSGGDQAQAATLLALACYARGDGPGAGAALRVALAANPEHELARLLDACLFAGVDPKALRILMEPSRLRHDDTTNFTQETLW